MCVLNCLFVPVQFSRLHIFGPVVLIAFIYCLPDFSASQLFSFPVCYQTKDFLAQEKIRVMNGLTQSAHKYTSSPMDLVFSLEGVGLDDQFRELLHA